MPRIAPRVGATRKAYRLRLTDGTHTARHRLAPHPRHMRERPRQPTHTHRTPRRSHCHTRALDASAKRRHPSSCTRSIERSKPVVLGVLSATRARMCQLGSGGCVRRDAVARPTCSLKWRPIHGACRLSCDARTPGGQSRAVGHDARSRGHMCCVCGETHLDDAASNDPTVCERVGGAQSLLLCGRGTRSACATRAERRRGSSACADAWVITSRVADEPE